MRQVMNSYSVDPLPPHLVHVVIEWPLICTVIAYENYSLRLLTNTMIDNSTL